MARPLHRQRMDLWWHGGKEDRLNAMVFVLASQLVDGSVTVVSSWNCGGLCGLKDMAVVVGLGTGFG